MSKNIDLNLLQKLEGFGLGEKESLVYITLLREGEMSAIKISRDSTLHRQFVYNALRLLKERGMVVQVGEKRARWRALSPRKLIAMAEEKQKTAESLSAELLTLMKQKAGQEFDLIEGRLAFRARQLELIRNTANDTTLLMICGQWERYFTEIGEVHYGEYERIRRQKNISIRFVGPRAKEEHMKMSEKERPLVDYRYVPGLETGLVNTIITGDIVDFEIYGQPHVTFSIKNSDVAESQRLFFESLWNAGAK